MNSCPFQRARSPEQKAERRAQILDFDWTYRRVGFAVLKWISAMWTRLAAVTRGLMGQFFASAGNRLYHLFSPAGAFSQDAPSGIAAILTAVMLAGVLLVVYFL